MSVLLGNVEDGLPKTVQVCENLNDSTYDVIVFVATGIENLPPDLEPLRWSLKQQEKIDPGYLKVVSVVPVDLPCTRMVVSPTGPVNRDQDDVRRWSDAACVGVKRAIQAGCNKILLVRPPGGAYPRCDEATVLGAFNGLYTPLELREAKNKRTTKATVLGFWSKDKKKSKAMLQMALGIERGKLVCRDLAGSDPERMCPAGFEDYVTKTFLNSPVKVDVEKGKKYLEKYYPLLSAVNRGSEEVERFRGCVINLEYVGEGTITDTLLIVGKGVTYDTGGHDIKADGVMAGMHRDKCGAAAVAGFFKSLVELKPKHIKAIGCLGIVRNAVGINAYVADELMVSRAGVRIRIGNTDAEGRMVMADLIYKMKEQALKEVNPHVMTWATLTGHCRLANGTDYASIMDNGPAKNERSAYKIQHAGEEVGDMMEISSIRREDYDAHKGGSEYEDLLQAHNPPSVRVMRGHQGPAAFLVMTSGMDKHGRDSNAPIKYTHIDLGNSGPFPGIPSAAPIAAVMHAFTNDRE